MVVSAAGRFASESRCGMCRRVMLSRSGWIPPRHQLGSYHFVTGLLPIQSRAPHGLTRLSPT